MYVYAFISEVITGNFSNMKRHAECKQHQQALAQLGLIEVTADENAPSLSAFEQVARGQMKGPSALRQEKLVLVAARR